MNNFDFLKKETQFSTFADTAIAAEQIYQINPNICVSTCRQAMEFAVKWMYSVDSSLNLPYQDKLVTLISTEEFKDIIGDDICKRLEFIRRLGNLAIHNPNKKYSKEEAALALENLFYICDFIVYCYGDIHLYSHNQNFNRSLLETNAVQTVAAYKSKIEINKLVAENERLKKELTSRRKKQRNTYVPKPLELSEYETRKIYINTMLQDTGWTEGKDWINEYKLEGMPNKSGIGKADYVLFGNDGKPLALIEAKKTCKDVAEGRQQAKLYADLLEKKFKRRPIIFLTNGFETRIWNDRYYPEHRVASIYSKRDLEKEFNKLTMRTHLENISINDKISGRYYQKEAIQAVCDAFDKKNRRKALLVMATGSGKTRTVISLVDVLIHHGWVKNILFLADRTSLITQAKRAFVNLLPDLSITNLCEEKDNLNARCVFSTYQTMINCIDDIQDENGKRLFTCGHFDLVICDEAHRSIYNKYKDIFTYFDSYLIGLTATPKDEIDHNTYEIFELENGVPTYGYELEQAVKDGFLVDYVSVETELKFMYEGIYYNKLSESEKEEYEEKFTDENGDLPDKIENTKLNEFVFNIDTIRKMFHIIMTHGIYIESGSKLGKTIIFAKNHDHAEKIYEIFGKEYPNYPSDFCRVIDNRVNYAQSLIDEFSSPENIPQIAVSVDMMDTGIDVSDCVNLVFFKKVMSKAKFWQMIGRGTRLCPKLIDGMDKDKFYIFDFCRNFEFFRMNEKIRETKTVVSIQQRLFNLKIDLCFRLQEIQYKTDNFMKFRKELVLDLCKQIKKLNRDNFAVHQHLKYIDKYSEEQAFDILNYENILQIQKEISPFILPIEDEISALRFDSLIYQRELALLENKPSEKEKGSLLKKVKAISEISTIPEISAKKELIQKLLHTDYIKRTNIENLEIIRKELRNLMKYISKDNPVKYTTGFTDEILNIEWNDSELKNDDLVNYKAKAAHYIRQHQDNIVIQKLKTNKPLTQEDIKQLEIILWSEAGKKEEYEKELGNKPLGAFVREIVGLDMNAAKEAFSDYLNNSNMNLQQSYFVNQIIEYIVQNGTLEDKSILQESPFTDQGSFSELFDTKEFLGILEVINKINSNTVAA